MTLPVFEDPIPTDTPIEEGATLQLYNWKDYLWPKLYQEFETKYADYGVKIEVTTFNDIAQGSRRCRPVRSQPTSSSPTHPGSQSCPSRN